MKSTLLYLIVKQWFEDKSGTELDDGVLEAIIKELTEKKDNRITITDIEPKSNRIHYESKKDAEPLEEIEWISVNDRMPTNDNVFRNSNPLICKLLHGQEVEGFTKSNIFRNKDGTHQNNVTHWKYKNN
jgi:hypothetical protein